jgi:NAD-dependent SIR2 family protein deacetylase
MPSQNSKKPRELTTEEAIRRLFPPKVIEHAKERASEADRVLPRRKHRPKKKSMSED